VIVKDADLEPARVLVACADARTVRVVVGCGYRAALSLSGGAGGPRAAIDQAVKIVRSLGPEGIVLGSDAGLSGGDLLALPRTADRLAKAGLGRAVIRRVCGGNVTRLLGVDPAALRRGASVRSGPPSSP
jgi:uncharacterized protein